MRGHAIALKKSVLKAYIEFLFVFVCCEWQRKGLELIGDQKKTTKTFLNS